MTQESPALAGTVTLSGNANGIARVDVQGHRDLASGAPMTPDTLFQIASMTKALVSVAALQLVERGVMSLDAPLGDLLPALADPQVIDGFDADGAVQLRPAKRPITLRHLLTHTSGLGYEFMNATLVRALGPDRPGPGSIAALNVPLLFDPGERWEYGISTDWAGLAIEAATGQALGEVLNAQLLGPLGMTDTAFTLSDEQRARAAMLYLRDGQGGFNPLPIEFGGGPNAEFQSGGGGLWSSATDYYRFAAMILNGGIYEGQRIIAPETHSLLTTNQIGDLKAGEMATVNPMMAIEYDPFPGMDCGWSMAFVINPEQGPNGRSAGSLAWAGIANCHYWIDLARGETGIFMTQLLPFGDPQALDAFGAFERGVTGGGA
jgi:methyl acetate hydrolase